jgi:hypothetical protein
MSPLPRAVGLKVVAVSVVLVCVDQPAGHKGCAEFVRVEDLVDMVCA